MFREACLPEHRVNIIFLEIRGPALSRSAVPLFRLALFCSCTFLRISTSCLRAVAGVLRSRSFPLGSRRPASGRNAMKQAINSASILSVLAEAPRLLPKALTCAGGSCRAGIPAASRLAQRRHSQPPAASKQTKAFLSPAMLSSSEWPSSVFGKRSWRLSVRQWMPSQSRETSKPMISGCGIVFILTSFWSAVLDGRNQLFETMKRGGAGLLTAWSSHKVLTPCTAPSPAFVKVGDGNAISWLRYRKYWVTFACRFTDAARKRVLEVQRHPAEVRIFEDRRLIVRHPVLEGRNHRRVDPGHRRPPPSRPDPAKLKDAPKRSLAFYDAVGRRLAEKGARG